MEKVICDRCGKEVTYPATRKIYLSKAGREGGLDLCDKCHKELNEWFIDKAKSDLCIDALAFLQMLMFKQGNTKHEMPEYFEDDFYTLIKNYSLLNEHLLMNYNEGRRRLENEKK